MLPPLFEGLTPINRVGPGSTPRRAAVGELFSGEQGTFACFHLCLSSKAQTDAQPQTALAVCRAQQERIIFDNLTIGGSISGLEQSVVQSLGTFAKVKRDLKGLHIQTGLRTRHPLARVPAT